MRDDQVSYVVLERDRGGGFGTFLLGALVGAGLALLLAPKSGAEDAGGAPRRGAEAQGGGNGARAPGAG